MKEYKTKDQIYNLHQNSIVSYDYIIVGAGASGLSLVLEMCQHDFFSSKKIALIDPDLKKDNDRTWCYWTKQLSSNNPLEGSYQKTWNQLSFISNSGKDQQLYQQDLNINPYRYVMLRSKDFYHYAKSILSDKKNIDWITDSVTEFDNSKKIVKTQKKACYKANFVFSAVALDGLDFHKPSWSTRKYPLLKQHFLGWFIEAKKPCFDVEKAVFMDFSMLQEGKTRFMYVLPMTSYKALVEFTYFSYKEEEDTVYIEQINQYLQKHHIYNYTINETEKGVIPMTSYPFWKRNTETLHYIGTQGGWNKASTGFMFANAQRKSKLICDALIKGESLSRITRKDRFWYYDLWLLDVLYDDNGKGKALFTKLFLRNKIITLLDFLDGSTHFYQELFIMAKMPWHWFIKVILKRCFVINHCKKHN